MRHARFGESRPSQSASCFDMRTGHHNFSIIRSAPSRSRQWLAKTWDWSSSERNGSYFCFISYSSKNQAFAERLYNELQGKGVRCWYAPEDLKIGERIRVGIDEAIRVHDKLLLVLSKHSVASDWVEKDETRRSLACNSRASAKPAQLGEAAEEL